VAFTVAFAPRFHPASSIQNDYLQSLEAVNSPLLDSGDHNVRSASVVQIPPTDNTTFMASVPASDAGLSTSASRSTLDSNPISLVDGDLDHVNALVERDASYYLGQSIVLLVWGITPLSWAFIALQLWRNGFALVATDAHPLQKLLAICAGSEVRPITRSLSACPPSKSCVYCTIFSGHFFSLSCVHCRPAITETSKRW
jgi:hypothetical protein